MERASSLKLMPSSGDKIEPFASQIIGLLKKKARKM